MALTQNDQRIREGLSVAVDHCVGCAHKEFIAVGPTGTPFFEVVAGREYFQPTYTIHECSQCGLLYRTPVLSESEFSDYYSSKDFRDWETPGEFPTERTALKILRALPPGAKVLDFGCSSGRLFAKLGSTYDRYGSELNQDACAVAASKGLKMLPTTFLETKDELRFDAIILVDVFEHLTAPTSLLANLASRLNPGGILIIVTGDGDNVICRRNPAEFWYFRIIEHVSMLTQKYARWLAGELQLELKSWQTVRHYDYKWPATLIQWARQFAYWHLTLGPSPMRTLLRMIPRVRNAERRTKPPFWQYSADHVVAVFAKKR